MKMGRMSCGSCGYRAISTVQGEKARVRSTAQFLVSLLLAIFISEGAIMLLIPRLPAFLQPWKELLDTLLLTAVLAPVLYYRSVRPLSLSLSRQTAMADDLRNTAIYLDSMHEAMCAVDLEGKILSANRALHVMWALKPENLEDTTVFDLLPPEERPKQREAFDNAMLQGKDVAFETVCVRPDGTRIPLIASASSWQDGKGGAAGWISVFTNITERKEAEALVDQARRTAEEAARAKGEFLANMSHEIRTPMNGIIGLSHLLSRSCLDERQADQVSKIQSSAKLLLQLINDILDFSKIEAGRLAIESVPFSVEELFSEVADMLVGSAEAKGLEFLFKVDRRIPTQLMGDPLRLKQVLINLTSNAIKFTAKGEVLVSCSVESVSPTTTPNTLQCTFSVTDTGIGLTEDQRNRLFQAFTQADNSISRRYGGTGLGLVICQRLVQLMGGGILLESEPGRGTRVHFCVPLAPLADASAHEPRPLIARDFRGRGALVIDDNATSREILRTYLQHFGFEVVTGSSGAEGLNILENAGPNEFPLILVDQRMPGMDGIQTISRIRSIDGSRDAHAVIMVSAYDRESIEKNSHALAIDGFLPKPVNPSHMFDLLMKVFSEKPDAAEPLLCVAQRVKASDATPDLSGFRVLLAEDNAINQLVAREILKSAGLEVIIAANGLEALEQLNSQHFDIVLMDVQMPEMDGLEASRQIRADKRFDALPVIAMTAHAMSGDRERSLAAGMNDHTTKPIDPPHLFDTIARWLKVPSDRLKPGKHHPKPQPPPQPRNPSTPLPLPPPTPTTTAPASLPASLPGLNVAEGVNRLFDDTELYRAIVLEFCETHLEAGTEIRAFLAAGNREEAIRLAHLIRGASGNLSANDLHRAAGELESALRSPREILLLMPQVEAFARELEVLRGTEKILRAGAAQAHTS